MEQDSHLPPNLAKLKRIVIIMVFIMVLGAALLGYAAFKGIAESGAGRAACVKEMSVTVPQGQVIASERVGAHQQLTLLSDGLVHLVTLDPCKGTILQQLEIRQEQ